MSTCCPRCNRKAHIRWSPSKMWVWHAYVCRGCGAKLRQNFRRRLFIGLPLLVIATTLQIVGAESHHMALVIAGMALVFIAITAMLYLDRVDVVSPGPFCTKCEYDLTLVPEGAVCPECGAAMPSSVF